MSRFVNISELADQVLESVRADSSTKIASAPAPARVYVPAAQELRKLAADLREAAPEEDVSDADLATLMQDPEVMQLMQELEANPELLQTLLAQGAGGPEGQEIAGSAGGPPGDMPVPDMMPSGAHPGMDAEAASGMPPGDAGGPPPAPPHHGHEHAPPHHGHGHMPPPHHSGHSGEQEMPPGLKAASELRKIAAYLKTHNEHAKRVRFVKAAQMLTAATGLKHLTEGFK